MSKIKDIFQDEQRSLGQVLRRYTGTLILVFLLCVFFFIVDTAKLTMKRNEEYIMLFLIMAIVGVFFTETCLRGKRSKEAYLTGYILSAMMAFLWIIVDVVQYSNDSKVLQLYYRVLALFYILSLVGLSLVSLVRESELPFEQYAVRMIFAVLQVGLILLVVNIGFILIFGLLDKLIANINIWSWIYRMELILIPVVYVPYFLTCLTTRTEKRPGNFTRGIVLYAMMPIYIGAVVIIYAYIIKILVTWDFPVNQVFSICAGLFSAGVVIWTMAYAFTRRDRSKLYNIIIRYMKYIVAPMILLELYAMIIRIHEYGWTIARSYGIYFISLQIVYTAWEPILMAVRFILKKEKPKYGESYEGMVFVALLSYIFCFIIPWTSAEYVEDASQEKRFEAIVADMTQLNELNRDWTPEEYQQMAKLRYEGRSVRSVLSSNIYGEIYLKSKWKGTDFEKLFSMPNAPGNTSTYDVNVDEWSYSSFYNGGYPKDHLSVQLQDYQYFYTIQTSNAYDDILSMEDIGKVKMQYGMNQAIRVDLVNLVKIMTETENGKVMEPTEIYSLKLDTGLLIITNISFRYSDVSKEVRDLAVEGYLFLP